MLENSVINVTWFSEYPTLDIVSDEYVGSKVIYKLKAVPLSASYVWVYKNGIRLTQDVDYKVSIPRGVVYLLGKEEVDPTSDTRPSATDRIKIIQFGSKIFRESSAYEIYKDMFNIYQFKRYSENEVVLTKSLAYFDTEIHLTSTDNLPEPNPLKNIAGVIMINGERISYLEKTETTLSKLRRGSFGSSIPEEHLLGSRVVNLSYTESIPYNETQERLDFVSDGSSLLIGPLDYTPKKYEKNIWFRGNDPETNIPEEFGPCYEIEVFVGGKRLRKDPLVVYDELLGSSSPSADTTIKADFSVDGEFPFVRLSERVDAGTRITIIRKVGKTWYDRGNNSASTGVTLLENAGAIPVFIAKNNTRLPE
jgi:hypothetical protein